MEEDILTQFEAIVKEQELKESRINQQNISNKMEKPQKQKKVKENTSLETKKEEVKIKDKKTDDPKDQSYIVLNYMLKENRPYGLLNILENLKKAIKKPDLLRILEQLTSQGKIKTKIFGKFAIYFANQDIIEFDESKLNDLKSKLLELKEEQSELQEELKERQDILKQEEQNLSTDQLKQLINQLQKKLTEINQRLQDIKKLDNKTIDPEEMRIAEDKLKEIQIKSKKYKGICKEIFNVIQESTEMNKKQMYEQLRLDEDLKIQYILQ